MDLQQLLAAAQQMQDQLVTAQRELADATIEGTAGSGLVKAVVNGEGKLVDLTISAAAIDPADAAETAETVADLVLAAVRDAYRKAEELQQEKMGPLAAGIGGGGDAGGIPGLSDFFGGGAAALGGGQGQPGQGQPGQAPRPGQPEQPGDQPGQPEQPGDQPGQSGGRPAQPGP